MVVTTQTDLGWADLDDEQLAIAIVGVGDVEAFTELARRHTVGLHRYLSRQLPVNEVDDVVQEVLLAAWKSLPGFKFHSTVRTWLFTLAHRKVADFYRRTRPVPVTDDVLGDVPAKGVGPLESAVSGSLSEALARELDLLPYVSRAVWWLREIEGLSLAETASALRITEGSARGHLQRSRKRLAKRLEPWRPGNPATEHGPPPPAPDTPHTRADILQQPRKEAP